MELRYCMHQYGMFKERGKVRVCAKEGTTLLTKAAQEVHVLHPIVPVSVYRCAFKNWKRERRPPKKRKGGEYVGTAAAKLTKHWWHLQVFKWRGNPATTPQIEAFMKAKVWRLNVLTISPIPPKSNTTNT